MKLNRYLALNFGVVAVYFLAIAFRVKEFSVWTQIVDLARTNVSITHPHAVRFAVMYPVIYIAKELNVNPSVVFGYAVVICISAISFLIARIVSATSCGNYLSVPRMFAIAFVPLAGLSFAMNGRIALAMLGIIWIVSGQVGQELGLNKSRFTYLLSQLLGSFLAAVSSGTIAIAFLSVMTYNVVKPLISWPKIKKADMASIWIGFVMMILTIPVVIIGLVKNLEFFGGDDEALVKILTHGLGKYLPSVPAIAVGFGVSIFLIVIIVGLVLLSELRKGGVRAPLFLAAVLATIGGAFGVSTLVSSVPVMLTLLLQKVLGARVKSVEVVRI